MSFLELLPIIIVAVIVIYLLIKMAPLLEILFHLITIVYWFLCNLFKWIVWPLGWLANKIKQLLGKAPAIATIQATTEALDDTLERFGGLSPLVLFASSIVFIAISLLVFWCQGRLEDSLLGILLNNTFGSFLSLLQDGFSFTPGTLISASFASFLAHLCIDKADRVKWYIWIPYCVVFIGMSSILSSFFTGAFDAIGTWGYNSILALWNSTGSTFMKVLRFVPLIVLAYFAIVFLVITVREYFCSILFGVLGMIALIIIALILQAFNASSALTDLFVNVTVLGSMIGIEKIRSNIERDITEKADEESAPAVY